MFDDQPTGQNPRRGAFPSTRWSLIVSAGGADSRSDEALATLCQGYWSPIYSYVRRRGYPVEQAEDLTQGFFTKLLEKNYVAQASRERGRFRTFLLSSFKNYMANEWDRTQAQKRGGGQHIVSLDVDQAEARLKSEPAETTTPEDLFARQWARTLLDRVLEKLRAEMESAGRGDRFRRMKGLLTGSEAAVPYRKLAEELDMTEAAVKVTVHRMRRRFAALLRAEVAETVESEEAVTDEIRFLIDAIGS